MSLEANPQASAAPTSPSPTVQDDDTDVRDYGALFEEPEAPSGNPAATPEPAKPSEGAAPDAAGRSSVGVPASPQTPSADDGVIDWKDEDGEKKFNVYEHFRDPEKRKVLRDLIEKGHAFERVVPRREAAATREAFKEIQAHAEEQGYTLTWDANAQKVRIAPKVSSPQSGQVATPTGQAAQDADPLATEERELRAKIKAAELVDPDWLIRLQEIIAERKNAPLVSWKASQEQAARQAAERQFEQNLSSFRTQYRAAKAGSFEGLSDAEYAGLVKGFADSSKTWEELRAKLDSYAARIDKAVQARVASMTKAGAPAAQARGPAPAAPPVNGGTAVAPGGGANGTKKETVSTFDRGAFQKELDEFFG